MGELVRVVGPLAEYLSEHDEKEAGGDIQKRLKIRGKKEDILNLVRARSEEMSIWMWLELCSYNLYWRYTDVWKKTKWEKLA